MMNNVNKSDNIDATVITIDMTSPPSYEVSSEQPAILEPVHVNSEQVLPSSTQQQQSVESLALPWIRLPTAILGRLPSYASFRRSSLPVSTSNTNPTASSPTAFQAPSYHESLQMQTGNNNPTDDNIFVTFKYDPEEEKGGKTQHGERDVEAGNTNTNSRTKTNRPQRQPRPPQQKARRDQIFGVFTRKKSEPTAAARKKEKRGCSPFQFFATVIFSIVVLKYLCSLTTDNKGDDVSNNISHQQQLVKKPEVLTTTTTETVLVVDHHEGSAAGKVPDSSPQQESSEELGDGEQVLEGAPQQASEEDRNSTEVTPNVGSVVPKKL